MLKKTVSTWEAFSKASDFVFHAVWKQFYYIFMYKEDTFYVPDGVKIYMLFIIVKVYLIWLKRNERCPTISDLIQPHMKNKTVEKAKHKIQNYYRNRKQHLICKLFESLLTLVHKLKFRTKLAKWWAKRWIQILTSLWVMILVYDAVNLSI